MLSILSQACSLFNMSVQVVSEQYIRDSQQGLRGMYVAILDFIPKHCHKLNEVTAGTAQG